MKLTVRCRSGLRIDFEGSLEELERFDGFLAELARLERDRLAPAPHDAIGAAVASPHVVAFEPVPIPSPPMAPGLAAEPDGGDRRPDPPAAGTAGESSRPLARTSPRAGGTGRPAHSRDAVLAALRTIAQARAAMSAQLAERHGAHHAQALALVAEHGPVSYSWVADQLVKNRRDTAALMRDMAAAGELVETDEGGYYDIPDRDDQEQAVAA